MNGMMNMMKMFQQFKSNPMQMLSRRFNIPQDIANDPNEILQHLINTNQVSQNQIDQISQMANMFKR